MQIDYNKLFKNQIATLEKKGRLFLHACCSVCAIGTLEKVRNFFDVTLFYYNPNIDTKEEFERRKPTFYENIIVYPYKFQKFDSCEACVSARLQKTFNEAKSFDFIATTLTISPKKNATQINELGKKIADKKWLFSDFKKENGYLTAVNLAKAQSLYRQSYCGCLPPPFLRGTKQVKCRM